jgi:hypothetical protein
MHAATEKRGIVAMLRTMPAAGARTPARPREERKESSFMAR